MYDIVIGIAITKIRTKVATIIQQTHKQFCCTSSDYYTNKPLKSETIFQSDSGKSNDNNNDDKLGIHNNNNDLS